jgi:hypothetical protein
VSGRTVFQLAQSAFMKQRPYYRARFKANGSGNVQKFQHVKASVSTFIFRDVRRRLA